MDPEELERIAHELERLTSTRDVGLLLARLEALGETVKAEVVRAALGHLPDERWPESCSARSPGVCAGGRSERPARCRRGARSP